MLAIERQWLEYRVAVFMLLWLTGCSSGDSKRGPPDDRGDASGSSSSSSSNSSTSSGEMVNAGLQMFDSLCAECHAPTALVFARSASRQELVQAIAETMPPYDPNVCDQVCAEAVAAYVGERNSGASSWLPMRTAARAGHADQARQALTSKPRALKDCWNAELVPGNLFDGAEEASFAYSWRGSVRVDWPSPAPGTYRLSIKVGGGKPQWVPALVVAHLDGVPVDSFAIDWRSEPPPHTFTFFLRSQPSRLELTITQDRWPAEYARQSRSLRLIRLSIEAPDHTGLPAVSCGDDEMLSCAIETLEALGGTLQCQPVFAE